ncbi:MAG: hypothetical protein HY319_22815 [Armatimonadetes bacterium]|nr:hypothetical protein [Armatimonadota bacterium]
MLIERLTAEQVDLIPVVCDQWQERAESPVRLDSCEVRRCVDWLYARGGLGAPRVACAAGPLEAECALKPEGFGPEALKRELIRPSLGSQLHRQAAFSAVTQFRSLGQYGPPIRAQDEIYEARVRMPGLSGQLNGFWRCHFGLADCAWWTAEYDYWARIGLTFEGLDGWCDFLRCGIWDGYYRTDLAVVFPAPTVRWELRDGERRLHSTTEPAIEWPDGFRLYFVSGVWVEDGDLIEDPARITLKRILREKNAEIRQALIRVVGPERFLGMTRAEVVDEDTDRAGMPRRLLRLVVGRGEQWCILEVECPSKHDKHYLWVPPHSQRCSQAVAWTFGFEVADYLPLVET